MLTACRIGGRDVSRQGATPPCPSYRPCQLLILSPKSSFCKISEVLSSIHLIQAQYHRNYTTVNKMAKSAALEKFESVFPKLVEDLLAHSKSYNLPEQALKWYNEVSL